MQQHTAVMFKVASQPAALALQTEKHQTNKTRHTPPDQELRKALRAAQKQSQHNSSRPGALPLPRCCCTQGSAGAGRAQNKPSGPFCKCCIHTCKRDGQTKAEAHYSLPGTPLGLWYKWTVFNIQINLETCFIFLTLWDVFDDQALFFLHYNKGLH